MHVHAGRWIKGWSCAAALSLWACAAHAAPPVFVGNTVRAPIPFTSDDPPISVNLRDQKVLGGSPAIRVTVEQILINGQPPRGQIVVAHGDGTGGFGAICLSIYNPGFTVNPNTTITVDLSAENAETQTPVRGSVTIVNDQTGPVVTSPFPVCGDPGASSANQPPIAQGLDQTIDDQDGMEGEANITLDASASRDPDGRIVSYQWTTSTGQTFTSSDPTIEEVSLPDGTHVLTLVVTDDQGASATDTVTITVNRPFAPIIDAGADQTVEEGTTITLTGTASDPDGSIVEYGWYDGDTVLGDQPQIQTQLSLGVHTLTFIATDNVGLSADDTVQITVIPKGSAPTPPTASAGADQEVPDSDGEPGETITLTGTGTDADGSITSYEWWLDDSVLGTTATLQTQLPDGVHVVTLTVTDDSGLTASDTVQITVGAPVAGPSNNPPAVNAGADQTLTDADGQPGETISLSGNATDDGTIESYQWFIDDTLLGEGATLQARIPDGVSVISLVVTDDSGLTASDTVQISVAAPVLPIVDAGVARTIEDTDVQAGEDVQLSGSATTSAGTITQYQWLLGNNVLGTGQTITARLPDGVNLVTLRATNSVGLVGSASVQITVSAGVRTVLANIPGLTPNERRLAEKLDEACNNVLGPLTSVDDDAGGGVPIAQKRRPPTQAEVSDFKEKCRGLLLSKDNAALANAMGALLGDDFAVARTQTLLFANTQYASVMDRLIALRGGAKGLSLAGLNIMVDGQMIPLAELQGLAKQLLGGGASSDADGGLWSDKWGLWARGNYSFGSKDDDSLSPSFDADQFALLAGLDYRLTESAVIGGALAYGNSTVDFNPSSEGSLDTESWALSLYGSVYAKKNFYFDAIVNIADSGYDARRNITYVDGYGLVNTDASGDTGGLTLSGGLSGGYDFLIGGLTISPTLGMFYIDAQIDEFTESGAGGLNLIYDEQQFKSFTGNLGVRMTFAWNLPWGVLLPHLRADFVREFEDDVDVFGIRFASDPNAASTPPILVETDNPDSSYWRLAAGFSAQFKHGISGYVEYQRLESFKLISFEDISLGLRFQAAF